MSAQFKPTPLRDVVLISPKIYKDDRGFFFESFKASLFAQAGLPHEFVQENVSFSRAQVIRGLHYQRAPKAQHKLVRVVSGKIWDVAVDIRPNSPRFGQWHAEVLSAENGRQLYIPDGFAHGFEVLSESATVIYQTTHEYAPDLEGGILWNDPQLTIDWAVDDPIISPRDQSLAPFDEVAKRGGFDCFRL